MLIKELLTEASVPRRAWDGKLKRIDDLLAWMYDKDILNKGEKAKKDQIFNAYYRYYNDGDMPAALKIRGLSKYSNEKEVETALEKYLEDFMKSILKKYLPKVDRTEFRLTTAIDGLNTVIDVASRNDAHGLLTYWLKTVKLNDEDSALKAMVDTLDAQYKALKEEANEVDPDSYNKVMSFRMEDMKEAKKWNKSLQKKWDALTVTMAGITQFLKNVQSSLKDLKKQHLVSDVG